MIAQWEDEEDGEEEEVGHGHPVVVDDQFGNAVGEDPEGYDGDGEGAGEDGC